MSRGLARVRRSISSRSRVDGAQSARSCTATSGTMRTTCHGGHQHQRRRQARRQHVDGALVVERPGREVRAQHYATRSRRTTPTAGASASSSSAPAAMRSAHAARAAEVERLDRTPSRSSRPRRSRSPRSAPRADAPDEHARGAKLRRRRADPRDTSRSGARDRPGRPRVSSCRVRKKIRSLAADDRQRGVVGGDVHDSSQSPAGDRRRRTRQRRVDQVERREIDEPALRRRRRRSALW